MNEVNVKLNSNDCYTKRIENRSTKLDKQNIRIWKPKLRYPKLTVLTKFNRINSQCSAFFDFSDFNERFDGKWIYNTKTG